MDGPLPVIYPPDSPRVHIWIEWRYDGVGERKLGIEEGRDLSQEREEPVVIHLKNK